MKKLLLILLVLSACVSEPYEQPSIEKEVVEKLVIQCWDGSIAESLDDCPPRVEVKEPAPELAPEPDVIPVQDIVKVAPTIPIAKKLLANARTRFEGHAYLLEDRMVIVYGDKTRHYFSKISMVKTKIPITDVFVDLKAKTAVAYCNIEREGRMLDNAFDYERSRCKDYIDQEIPLEFQDWVSKGPLEYLEDFAALEPIIIEDNVQTVSIGGNSKTVQPSIHYMVNGKRVILRIDKRYQVPLKIEYEGRSPVDFRDTFFDVMVLDGKQEKIDSSWTTYQPVSDYWKQG